MFGETWTVSNAFNDDDGPQPPKVLKAPVEIQANLRLLLQSHDPLVVTFHERSQRFQSFLVEVDKDRKRIALDELVPNDGERFMRAGEYFRVEGFHDGVRIAWECRQAVQVGDYQGDPCYWCPLPEEVTYHQRRNAFRAPLLKAQPVPIELAGDRLPIGLHGEMLDISATGCKLRFRGNVTYQLQTGQVYERFTARLPFGALVTPVELRHLSYDEKLDATFAGARFYRMNGPEQRLVERFVYQLQREARRFDKDDLF